MNIMQTVIDAAKQYSPKHAVKFENAIRESRSDDIPVLANLVLMVCAEHGVNPDIPNPFPHGADERDAWDAWCSGEAPPPPKPKAKAKPKAKPKQAKKAPAKKKA